MYRRWLRPIVLGGVTVLLATALGIAVAASSDGAPGANTVAVAGEEPPPPPPTSQPDVSSVEYIRPNPQASNLG
jgi:hypothetical protein